MRISLLSCFLTSIFFFGSDLDSSVTITESEPSTIIQAHQTSFRVRVVHYYRHEPYKKLYARKNDRPYPTHTKKWMRVIRQDD